MHLSVDEFDSNSGVQLSYKSTGLYEELYGEDYKLQVAVTNQEEIDLDEYKSSADIETLATYSVAIDDISDVQDITVEVTTQDDNLSTNTSSLYDFYKL